MHAKIIVGAALCRERVAQRPRLFQSPGKLPGLLHSPFATQGRSYTCCAASTVLLAFHRFIPI
ncbi:protein of unknown function [Pseudomonas sp. JV551A1]|nr:protein of unknown function [Pseudomonas sp. JV551A1]